MDLKQKMNQLEMQLKEVENKIKMLQKSCDHSIQKAAFRNPQSHGYQIMIVCDACGKSLRYPSENETNDFLKK